jgi:Sulfotransferase family
MIFKLYAKIRSKCMQLLVFIQPKPRKIIFDHIPKCGGTTLNYYLEKNYRDNKIFRINGSNPTRSIEEFGLLTHRQRIHYDLIRGHLANKIVEKVDKDYLLITMLRDPIDRIVSHYYYAKSSCNHYLNSFIVENNISLEQYVRSGKSEELENWYVSHFSGFNPTQVKQNPKIALKRAIENIDKYDLVGFVEDFDQFVFNLKKLARFNINYNSIRVNVTKNREKVDQISSGALNAIKELNSLDIEFHKKISLKKTL